MTWMRPDIMFKFRVDRDLCTLCGVCVDSCQMNALEIIDDELFFIVNRCTKCQVCADECEDNSTGALTLEVEFTNTERTMMEAIENGEEQKNELKTNLNCLICNRCG